ncbi:MAG: hypothetical protein LIP77_11460 [Planctomycetes bacterium]|nr:hypothetical protein [Planctomycetota bacterium]
MEPPRPRSPREVVFSLEMALMVFTVVLALIGSSFFLGYKRGLEEKPASSAGLGGIEMADPGGIYIPDTGPGPRTTLRPSEHDYTVVIRAEPVNEDILKRLEMELTEASAKGSRQAGFDIPWFIYRSESASPLYYLAVGIGRTATDPELEKVRLIFNDMDGLTMSRVPKPYLGCATSQFRQLGESVF